MRKPAEFKMKFLEENYYTVFATIPPFEICSNIDSVVTYNEGLNPTELHRTKLSTSNPTLNRNNYYCYETFPVERYNGDELEVSLFFDVVDPTELDSAIIEIRVSWVNLIRESLFRNLYLIATQSFGYAIFGLALRAFCKLRGKEMTNRFVIVSVFTYIINLCLHQLLVRFTSVVILHRNPSQVDFGQNHHFTFFDAVVCLPPIATLATFWYASIRGMFRHLFLQCSLRLKQRPTLRFLIRLLCSFICVFGCVVGLALNLYIGMVLAFFAVLCSVTFGNEPETYKLLMFPCVFYMIMYLGQMWAESDRIEHVMQADYVIYRPSIWSTEMIFTSQFTVGCMLISITCIDMFGRIPVQSLQRLVLVNSIIFMVVGFCGVTLAADMFYWLRWYNNAGIALQAVIFLVTLIFVQFKRKDFPVSKSIMDANENLNQPLI